VVGASLYIVVCSARNHLRVRLRRLREPKYLLGGIVGAAYLYFTIVVRMRGSSSAASRLQRRGRTRDAISPGLAGAGAGTAGLVLLVLACVAWLLPFDSSLVEFTPAETDFLLPAPVGRRQLLLHRLMRSQLGLLFAAVIPSIAIPSTTGAGRVRLAVSIWILLTIMKVYFAGVTLARSRFRSSNLRARVIAWTPPLVIAGLTAVTLWTVAGALWPQPPRSLEDFLTCLDRAETSGLASVALMPFTAAVRPLFASTLGAYLVALATSLLVLVLVTTWVMHSDEAFEDAAFDAARRRAEQQHPARAPASRVRFAGWSLAPSGPTESLFCWKNAMQTMRATGTTLVRYVVPTLAVSLVLSSAIMSANRLRGPAAIVCALGAALAAFAALLGPQIFRVDLRGDLEHLELLKTWPLESPALIRGEMLWPVIVVTVVSWGGLACAALFGVAAFPRVGWQWRVAVVVAAFLIVPALVAAQYTIHHAAAVLFPAWVPIGNQRPRGLDQMGQRLILLAGVVLSLAVMVLPAAIAAAIIWLAFDGIVGAMALIPGALVFASIVGVEVLLATEALGPIYDRLDLLSVER